MPSDESGIAAALRGAQDAFRSAVMATVEQVRGFLAAQRSGGGNGVAAELGRFAAGRIDFERFTSLLEDRGALDSAALERVEAVHGLLSALANRLHEVDVPAGASLRDAVAAALAEAGRVFGAVRVFEHVRAGRYREAEHAPLLEEFPYERWSGAERLLAPPLLVRVEGRGIRAEGLAEFLDGAQKLVLLIRGESPLAPLARLVTPRTFVLQTHDGTGLDRFLAWEGPGIAALVPESAARFVHDPAGGPAPWDRLTIGFLPEARAAAGRSAAQQAEERSQLEALASRPPAPAAPPPMEAAAVPADPVDRLAAWLLSQADLKDVP